MKQKHSLGQVFLKNKKYIDKIFDFTDFNEKRVLEIGPGNGDISAIIAQNSKELTCVEIDKGLCAYLQDKFKTSDNVVIVNSDIFNFRIPENKNKLVVFANVPYYISSKIAKYLIDNRRYIIKAYLMFQKEFVQKLIAKPNDKQYGVISCSAQYYSRVEHLFDIPKSAFSPIPGVDSSFVSMDFSHVFKLGARDDKFLFKLIDKAFSNKRKKIVNSLNIDADILLKFKVDPDLRPHQISLENYISLANGLQSVRGDK